MRKERKVEGLGVLSSRSAQDALNMNAFIEEKGEPDINFQLSVMVSVVSQSLSVYYHKISWWNLFKKFRLRKELNVKYLAKIFSAEEIIKFNKIVQELEGNLTKKKAETAAVESVETSQKQ